MLAFIVVLLVGLAAYTRVETSVAGNMQRQAQARENALFALNIAVGQLQKYAGPDTRVTATAEAFANVNGTSRYTGVWHSDATLNETPATPMTWLVSGNELRDADGVEQPLSVTPDVPGSSVVQLVGTQSAGNNAQNSINAPLRDIRAEGVPGVRPGASTTIGRYAWWVGDQGVKAPVAIPDTTAAIDYPPYDSAELKSRLRQQMSLGAGAADANANPVFEPLDTTNATLVANNKVAALSQVAFLRRATSTANVGPNLLRTYFHSWSPNNFAVLANTKTGGLRQDLSLNPGLLGAAFAAWANYSSYMEPPVPPAAPDPDNPAPPSAAPVISPGYGADPIRRRYILTPPGVNGEPAVSPALTYFYLFFGVRKQTADAPFTLSLRWAAALWNPYTSSLVPEDLRLEISGLPETVIVLNAETQEEEAAFPLRQLFGSPFIVSLPWVMPTDPVKPDKQSMLPGRVYNWTFLPGATLDTSGNPGRFDSADLGAFDQGLQVTLPGSATINSSSLLALRIPEKVTLSVRVVRASDGATLATYTSPEYDDVPTTDSSRGDATPSPLGYLFRLAESADSQTSPGLWLMAEGNDPRNAQVGAAALRAVPNGTNPAAYNDFFRVYEPERLLNRNKTTGTSYNEDAPLFELPRAPIQSMGMLQHLWLAGRRPFAIGNPWGAGAQLNGIPVGELFDRFFFSGVTAGVMPGTTVMGDLILPNPLLKPLRNADGTKPTIDDVRATVTIPATGESEAVASPAESRSSKYFLQGGAFNLNSTNPTAWKAVLRGVRYPTPLSFTYLDAADATGTADDDAWASFESGDAFFFRFPQSAQETFKAEPGMAETGAETPSPANTHLFRQGMRTLNAAQVDTFADRIVELVKARQVASGPFRSLEEFLAPQAIFGVPAEPPAEPPADPEAPPPPADPPRSLLEAAIEDAAINSAIAEFSSQWLTQADVMTALAPVLFPRSDTFVIRSYGEAINPAKLNADGSVPPQATEGRAWCEAIVQRIPEFFDPSDLPETPASAFTVPSDSEDPNSTPSQAHQLNDRYGRRFKIISFRWLTRADI
ncbi:MAG: hypothetical protein Q7S40_20675 [Opitutaceae bacterium]|nr:hypothetical protein [Opitutaceae bacterium]